MNNKKKIITDLTKSDIKEVPVWEIETHECSKHDEYTHKIVDEFQETYFKDYVIPTEYTSITGDSDKYYICKTIFIANNGNKFLGHCAPQDPSGWDYIKPTILTEGEIIELWHDECPGPDEPELSYRKLGQSKDKLFPMTVICDVPVDGKKFKDQINKIYIPDIDERTPERKRKEETQKLIEKYYNKEFPKTLRSEELEKYEEIFPDRVIDTVKRFDEQQVDVIYFMNSDIPEIISRS